MSGEVIGVRLFRATGLALLSPFVRRTVLLGKGVGAAFTAIAPTHSKFSSVGDARARGHLVWTLLGIIFFLRPPCYRLVKSLGHRVKLFRATGLAFAIRPKDI